MDYKYRPHLILPKCSNKVPFSFQTLEEDLLDEIFDVTFFHKAAPRYISNQYWCDDWDEGFQNTLAIALHNLYREQTYIRSLVLYIIFPQSCLSTLDSPSHLINWHLLWWSINRNACLPVLNSYTSLVIPIRLALDNYALVLSLLCTCSFIIVTYIFHTWE